MDYDLTIKGSIDDSDTDLIELSFFVCGQSNQSLSESCASR